MQKGKRQKEIFELYKKTQQPPVSVLVRQEACGQSFHGKRESKQTCVNSTVTFLWGEHISKHNCWGHVTSGLEEMKVIKTYIFPYVGRQEDITLFYLSMI